MSIMVVVFVLNSCYSQQLLMKFNIEDSEKQGYNVSMIYAIQSITHLENSLNEIINNSERELLKHFNRPIVEFGDGAEDCEKIKHVSYDDKMLFKKNRKVRLEWGSKIITIIISNSYNYEVCAFPLRNKYWGSYDVSYKEACTITNLERKCRKRVDKSSMNRIRNILVKKRSNGL